MTNNVPEARPCVSKANVDDFHIGAKVKFLPAVV